MTTPNPETQTTTGDFEPHLTEEEIIQVGLHEAPFFLYERAASHARHCVACRERLRFFEGISAEIITPGEDNVVHASFSEERTRWAAESANRPENSTPPIAFGPLNAEFQAATSAGERNQLVAMLVEPGARRWFRACHTLVHAGPDAEPCSAELLAALGSLPEEQCKVTKLHHAIALALRAEGRSIENSAETLAALAAEHGQHHGLALDIAHELLTEPAQLRDIIAAAVDGAPWHGLLRPAEPALPERSSDDEAPTAAGIVIEGRADSSARESVVVLLTVELVSMRRAERRSLRLHPAPAIAIWDRDADFRVAEDAATAYAASMMTEPLDVEVRWRLSRHMGGPLPEKISGSSMGLLFAFLLRRLLARPDEPIYRVKLPGLAIFGGVSASGEVLPVGGAVRKALHDGYFHTALMPMQPIDDPKILPCAENISAAAPGGAVSPTNVKLFTKSGDAVHLLQVADVETGAAFLEIEHQTRYQGFDFDLPAEPPDFVGRVHLTEALVQFVQETASGYGVVLGGMGCGKTSFMLHLIRRLDADGFQPAFHIVPSQPGAACRGENLAKKIYHHLRLRHITPEPVEWAEWDIVQKLTELLKFLGAKNAHNGRKTVVVIDAADQVEMAAGKMLIPDILPAELPPGVVVIISCIHTSKWLRDDVAVSQRFGIGAAREDAPLCTNDHEDVLRYLRRQRISDLPESLIERIIRHPKPPVFFTVVKRLADLRCATLEPEKRRDYLEKPEMWASPPDELVQRKINTIFAKVDPGGSMHAKMWDMFGVLAVVREPVCEQELSGLGLWTEGLSDVALREASSFFMPRKPDQPRHLDPFRFDHQSYLQAILDRIKDSGKLRCHRLVAEACLDWRRRQGLARNYALRNAPAHLRRARMWDELYELLTDFDYLVARMEMNNPASNPEVQSDAIPQQLAWKVIRDFDRSLHGQPQVPEDHACRPALEALYRAVEENAAALHESPSLLVQQLYNALIWDWSGTDLGNKLDRAMRNSCRVVLKCSRRPSKPPGHVRHVVLKGHRDTVNCVALSPDEKTIASASDDKTVLLWDIGTSRVRNVLRGHGEPVKSVAWGCGGRVLASLGSDVRIWNPETGHCIATLPVAGGRALACSPREELLAVGGADGSIRLFSTVDFAQTAVLRGRGPGVRCLAFSSDGRLLVAGTGDASHMWGTVEAFDVAKRAHLRLLSSLPYWAEAVAFCPGDKTVAVGGGARGGEVSLISIESGSSPRLLPLHRNGILGLAISQNGVLATGSYDYTVGLHDLKTTAQLQTRMAHPEVIRSVAISADGRTVISAGGERKVIVWHLRGTPAVIPAPVATSDPRICHKHKIHACRFSPCGGVVSTASEDGTARLFSKDAAPEGPEFRVDGESVSVSVISPDGEKIALASHKIIRIFERATGRMLHSLLGHGSWIIDLAWTPDSSRIVSVSEDTAAMVWNPRTRELLHTLRGHTQRLRAVAVSPDGTKAATSGDDPRILIWNLATGELLRTLHGHNLRCKALAWGAHGILASAGSDDSIKLWNPIEGRELGTLRGLSSEIWTLRFAPERFLAAGGKDGIARLFDINTQRQVAAYPCTDAVQALWFGENSRELRIAERNGADLVPNIHTVEIIEPARHGK